MCLAALPLKATRRGWYTIRCWGECFSCFKSHQLVSTDRVGRTITRLLWWPHRRGRVPAVRIWSRWDGHAEAKFTYIDAREFQRQVALYTQSQLAARRANSTFSLRPSMSPITPSPHPLHSDTYLFIALMRAHRRRRACPHTLQDFPQDCDCSKTTLYSCEEASALSLSVSLVWIQNNWGRAK